MRTKEHYHTILGFNVSEEQYDQLIEIAHANKRDIKASDIKKLLKS